MRFTLGVFMLAFGYALAYYGIEKFVSYKPGISSTELQNAVAPLPVLLGIQRGANKQDTSGKLVAYSGTTAVPFSLKTANDTNQTISATTPSTPSTGSGGQFI